VGVNENSSGRMREQAWALVGTQGCSGASRKRRANGWRTRARMGGRGQHAGAISQNLIYQILWSKITALHMEVICKFYL
jgi:hypothetical protein